MVLRFQSTSPVRGTTFSGHLTVSHKVISIHVPREGDDFHTYLTQTGKVVFQSTSPVRGTTPQLEVAGLSGQFQSTSPVRGTTGHLDRQHRHGHISIHVPREGDDVRGSTRSSTKEVFQSTSPVRGTTLPDPSGDTLNNISIHVPREGDDSTTQPHSITSKISIHVPREGDDRSLLHHRAPVRHFNPRPP